MSLAGELVLLCLVLLGLVLLGWHLGVAVPLGELRLEADFVPPAPGSGTGALAAVGSPPFGVNDGPLSSPTLSPPRNGAK